MSMFTENVMKAVQDSPLWKKVNEDAKALYLAHGRNPSDEEYQALRTMLICKVMLEDPTIQDVACEAMYNEFNSKKPLA